MLTHLSTHLAILEYMVRTTELSPSWYNLFIQQWPCCVPYLPRVPNFRNEACVLRSKPSVSPNSKNQNSSY